jgi:predicted dehydrogenase
MTVSREDEMAPLGIGLVGMGRHGMRYAQHLLASMPNARLVAVCRRNVLEGRRFAAEHAVAFFPDYRDLARDASVQAVVVVAPPSLARSICLEAVHAGKPVLVEKPLACTGTDARDMVRVAESAGVPLMTAQTLRFNRAVLALKSQLHDVGPPRFLTLTIRIEPRPEMWKNREEYAGRGVLLEIGVHVLDLVRFLTGEEVAEVRCEMDRSDGETPESRALVSLRTTGRLPCVLDVSRLSAGRMGRVEWIGEDGELIADWVRHRLQKITSNTHVQEWTVDNDPTVPATLDAFVGALTRGTSPPVSGRDGQLAVELADACYESARTGRSVRLPAPDGA